MLNTELMFSSKTDLRATPQDFYNELDKEFHFTLDPCATDENHKCKKYYTIKENWLKQSRDNEIVFCNPPYGREIKNRVQKGSLARGGWSLCFSPQERIRPDSMIISTISRKSDLLGDV